MVDKSLINSLQINNEQKKHMGRQVVIRVKHLFGTIQAKTY